MTWPFIKFDTATWVYLSDMKTLVTCYMVILKFDMQLSDMATGLWRIIIFVSLAHKKRWVACLLTSNNLFGEL